MSKDQRAEADLCPGAVYHGKEGECAEKHLVMALRWYPFVQVDRKLPPLECSHCDPILQHWPDLLQKGIQLHMSKDIDVVSGHLGWKGIF